MNDEKTLSFSFETQEIFTQIYKVSQQNHHGGKSVHITSSVFVSPIFLLRNLSLLTNSLNIFTDKRILLIVVETIIGSVFVAACGLFGFHTYLCTHALTTLEFFSSVDKKRECEARGIKYESEYSRGSPINNLRQVLGYQDSIMKVILIPSMKPSPPIVTSSKLHCAHTSNNYSNSNNYMTGAGPSTNTGVSNRDIRENTGRNQKSYEIV